MKVLFFTSPGCAPCAAAKPILQELQAKYGFEMQTILASQATQEVFVRFGVRAAPTLIVLGDGDTEVERLTGMMDQGRLVGFLVRAGVL